MKKSEITELFQRYKSGKCTQKEVKLLKKWIEHADFDFPDLSKDEILKDLAQIESSLPLVKDRPEYSLFYRIVGYAASITLIFGLLYFIYLQPSLTIMFSNDEVEEVHFLAPGYNQAILKLADGSSILLDSLPENELMKIENSLVKINSKGQLEYLSGQSSRKNNINHIITPKGGQYEVILPDGSHVWLNSDSKLSFINSFDLEDERHITLEGEGYFKVRKDSSRPFVVTAAGQQIKVLGTEFNVNAYNENDFIKASLVEGSVLFNEDRLIPGESALIKGNTTKIFSDNIDNVIAWKNGYFIFSEETLEEAMKQIARWYNLEVTFKDIETKSILLGGSISKFENADKVFRMIEKAGNIEVKTKGKEVIISKL